MLITWLTKSTDHEESLSGKIAFKSSQI